MRCELLDSSIFGLLVFTATLQEDVPDAVVSPGETKWIMIGSIVSWLLIASVPAILGLLLLENTE